MMVFGFTSVNSVHFNVAQASQVSGIIDSDTTWTKANSPYILNGNVLVECWSNSNN